MHTKLSYRKTEREKDNDRAHHNYYFINKNHKQRKVCLQKVCRGGGGDGTAACYDIKETCAID